MFPYSDFFKDFMYHYVDHFPFSINIFLFTNWNNTKCNTCSSQLDTIKGHYNVAHFQFNYVHVE